MAPPLGLVREGRREDLTGSSDPARRHTKHLCLALPPEGGGQLTAGNVDAILVREGLFAPWLDRQQQPFYDLGYGDDTTVLPGATECAQQMLLPAVEFTAAHSDLEPNKPKCFLTHT